MKSTTRDFSKNPSVATTPVVYRDANTVYRSLAAVPAQLEVTRSGSMHESGKAFAGKLVGPQVKNQGEVLWTVAKEVKSTSGDSHPCPIPLIVANAPHHTLLVESNPVSKVVCAVHELFQQHNVDAAYNGGKFKWKCACYDGETETRFVSRLFSVPGKANFFVLDFQRRSGDPFHFQSIYKAINFRLLKTGFIVCNDSRAETNTVEEPVFKTFKPLELPEGFDDLGDEAVLDIEPILRMCNSPFIDVQREGLAALAVQLSASEVARKSAASYSGKLMEIISLSRDSQVRRLATSAVAKLSLAEESYGHITEKGGVRVLVNILMNESEVLETRRHAGMVLLNLPSLDATSMSFIKSAAGFADPRLKTQLQDLQAKCV